MSSNILCGPCNHVNTHRIAKKWCNNCEEGFCDNCEQAHRSMKVTRDHVLISTDDYRKIENVPIKLKCETHGKKFDLYCTTHDEAICVACFPSLHKQCSDVISLDEAAKNAKRSTALDDLENSIKAVLENTQHFINNRNVAMKNLEIDEQSVRKSISEMRANVNKHLDELEKTMLDELSKRYGDCKSKYEKFQNHLNKTEKEIKLLQEQTSQLKRIGSDLQVFLGTRQINKLIHNEEQSIKTMTSTLQDYKIGIEIHQGIAMLLKNVDNFGKVKVLENTISLLFKEAKVDQAQIVHTPTGQSFDRTRLHLQLKFKIKCKKHACGCVILPNNHVLIANSDGITEYSDDGQHVRDIPVSCIPLRLTVIDDDRIAVSYRERYMEILNIKDDTVHIKVTFEWGCYGISYQNGKIYVLVVNEGIVEMDMSGNRLRTICAKFGCGRMLCMTATKERIYCTDLTKNIVYCCSITGADIWTFTEQSLVKPMGMSVDCDQNVFVVGMDSNNLMLIQHDGKVSKTLLNQSDGLNKPRAIEYNIDKKLLLICNSEDGYAFLYSVT